MLGSVVYLIEDITTLREQDEMYFRRQLQIEYSITESVVSKILTINPSVYVCASNTYIPRLIEISFADPKERTTEGWKKNYGADITNSLRR